MVVAAGAIAHAPLSRVPENTLKYAVGVMLTSFGIFWGTEGAGASWPGSDAAIPAIIALVLASSIALTAALRRKHARLTAVAAVGRGMNRIRAFGAFLYDFVIGDDPMIAAVIVVALGVTALVASGGNAAWWITPPAVIVALAFSLHRATQTAPALSSTDNDDRPGTRPEHPQE